MLKKQWKVPTAVPQRRGTERRKEILLKARYGIRLQTEGGKGLNQDMRRLMNEGLVCIKRSANTLRANVSHLVLTNLGRAKVINMGFDPDEERPEKDKPRFIIQGDTIDGTTRRVLMPHGREKVHLMRQPKTGETINREDKDADPVKYITYGWNKGDPIYHFWDEIPAVRNSMPLIPAGYLRETGRGLVLSHLHVLQVSGNIVTSGIFSTLASSGEPDYWVEPKKTLSDICDVHFIYRCEHRGSEHRSEWRTTPTLYVLCASETDLVTAKLAFGEGILFTGHQKKNG